jgi:hypothetical protein
MTKSIVGLVSLFIIALPVGPAGAWSASGRFGGSASGGGGSWSAEGARGGTASGGGGSWSGTGWRGGTASGGGGSWSAHGAYGGSASGSHYYGGSTAYYHGGSAYYHPPTTVNVYGSSCGSCGGWSTAGAAAAGVVVGAAVATAHNQAANANAYSAGYAAGSTDTAYAMNAIYATLPKGANSAVVGGTTYYMYNNTWFKPSYGANGVYYRVVPVP